MFCSVIFSKYKLGAVVLVCGVDYMREKVVICGVFILLITHCAVHAMDHEQHMNDVRHNDILQILDNFNELVGAVCRLDYGQAFTACQQGYDAHQNLIVYRNNGKFCLETADDDNALSLLGLLLVFDIVYCEIEYSKEREEKCYDMAQFFLEDCKVDANEVQRWSFLDDNHSKQFSEMKPIDFAIARMIINARDSFSNKTDLSLIKLLFQYNVDLTTTSLTMAIYPIPCNFLIDRCIKNNVDCNASGWSFYRQWGAMTPLMVACCAGSTLIVEKLLQAGADPNISVEDLSPLPFQLLLEEIEDEEIVLAITELLLDANFHCFNLYLIIVNAFNAGDISVSLYDKLLCKP